VGTRVWNETLTGQFVDSDDGRSGLLELENSSICGRGMLEPGEDEKRNKPEVDWLKCNMYAAFSHQNKDDWDSDMFQKLFRLILFCP